MLKYHCPVFQIPTMRVLVEAADWGSQAMGNSRYGSPRVSLERRTSGQWHFSGAPHFYEEFNITKSPCLVLDKDEWGERVNWCHLGEGASMVSKWKLAKVEEEEPGEEVEEEEDGQEEQEEEECTNPSSRARLSQ